MVWLFAHLLPSLLPAVFQDCPADSEATLCVQDSSVKQTCPSSLPAGQVDSESTLVIMLELQSIQHKLISAQKKLVVLAQKKLVVSAQKKQVILAQKNKLIRHTRQR